MAHLDCGDAYSKNPHDEDALFKAKRYAEIAHDSRLVLNLIDDILNESVQLNLELANINV